MATIPIIDFDRARLIEIDDMIEGIADNYTHPIAFDGTRVMAAELAAAEMFAALDEDGGVPTARFVIWLIDSGRMTAGCYVSKPLGHNRKCACFYGAIAVCEAARPMEREPSALLEALNDHGVYFSEGGAFSVDVDADGKWLAHEAYEHLDPLQHWRDDTGFTIVERMLMGGAVAPGDTAATNSVLAYVKAVMLAYIAEHEAQLAAAEVHIA